MEGLRETTMPMMYGPLCEKCLHPLERHGYVLTRVNGKEVRRCEIGVCTCVIMK